VISSLAYPNLLGIKRLDCCCCCCGLYPGETFDVTKFTISGIPPNMADALETPMELVLAAGVFFICM
jgi:hypothetical protein